MSNELSASEPEITREAALRAFQTPRAEAKANDVSDLSEREIEEEIQLIRKADQ